MNFRAMWFAALAAACHPTPPPNPPAAAEPSPGKAGGAPSPTSGGTKAANNTIDDCVINGQSAKDYYSCNVDFDNFVYTEGQNSHVFEQTGGNPCVWVSTTLPAPIFHLTSVPIGADPESVHVTFTAPAAHCPVSINEGRTCSSAPDSTCTGAQKDIGIAACEGFLTACDGG